MKILVVDDEQVNLEILEGYLKEEGYDVIAANNGQEGLTQLRKNLDVAIILLDRTMPVMDGMAFMKQVKLNPEMAKIPVILQTAVTDSESVVEGINAGAYYYLTKPYKKNMLMSVVTVAIESSRYKNHIIEEMRKHRLMLGLLNQAWFELRTMEEAQNLAYFIANSFPDPEKVVLGLSEMMLNAVEHGNLGIGYHEKGSLMMKGKLHDEITQRMSTLENQKKKVQVLFQKDKNEARVTIKDEGEGFNWQEFLEMRPDRATDPNGRGIIMARMMSFDDMEFRGKGNEVCCKVRLNK